MKKQEIQVDIEEYGKKYPPQIRVRLLNITHSTWAGKENENIFWLDKDQADKLAFHINSCLQDVERAEEMVAGNE